MSKWIPDRKVWAGGLFATLAYLAILASNHWFGTDIPLDAGAFIAIGIGKAGEYLLPPSLWDKIRRLNDEVIAVAASVPDVPVSAEVGRVAVEKATATVRKVGDDTFDAVMRRMRGGSNG